MHGIGWAGKRSFHCDFRFNLILKIFLLYSEAVHKMRFASSGQTKNCFFLKILLIFSKRGREGEWEGEKHWCERETSVCWTEHASQACALTGNRTSDLLLCGTMPNQLNHTHQGWKLFLLPIVINLIQEKGAGWGERLAFRQE